MHNNFSWQLRLTISAAILFSLVLSGVRCLASVTSLPVKLEVKIHTAEIVAFVRVKKIEEMAGSSGRSCGTNYTLDVIRSYKGTVSKHISFASDASAVALPFYKVKVGDQLLVLLRAAKFPDETLDSNVPDVIQQPSEPSCMRLLSANRFIEGNAVGESGYLVEQRTVVGSAVTDWLLYMDSSTVMPYEISRSDLPYRPDCGTAQCKTDPRRLVPWSLIDTQISSWLREK